MATGTKRSTAATSKGGVTRGRIVTLALGLFNENGPDRVTTAQIAAAAGINEGNLYYHFRTKEALVAAVLDGFEADAMALLAEGTADVADPAASAQGLSPALTSAVAAVAVIGVIVLAALAR